MYRGVSDDVGSAASGLRRIDDSPQQRIESTLSGEVPCRSLLSIFVCR